MDFPLFYLVFLLNSRRSKLDLIYIIPALIFSNEMTKDILSFNQFKRGKTSRDKRQEKKGEMVNVSSKSQNTQDRLSVVEMKGTTQEQQQR